MPPSPLGRRHQQRRTRGRVGRRAEIPRNHPEIARACPSLRGTRGAPHAESTRGSPRGGQPLRVHPGPSPAAGARCRRKDGAAAAAAAGRARRLSRVRGQAAAADSRTTGGLRLLTPDGGAQGRVSTGGGAQLDRRGAGGLLRGAFCGAASGRGRDRWRAAVPLRSFLSLSSTRSGCEVARDFSFLMHM